jgi:hypothetical protein
MRTRASLVGGTVHIKTAPGKGCELIVCFGERTAVSQNKKPGTFYQEPGSIDLFS